MQLLAGESITVLHLAVGSRQYLDDIKTTMYCGYVFCEAGAVVDQPVSGSGVQAFEKSHRKVIMCRMNCKASAADVTVGSYVCCP